MPGRGRWGRAVRRRHDGRAMRPRVRFSGGHRAVLVAVGCVLVSLCPGRASVAQTSTPPPASAPAPGVRDSFNLTGRLLQLDTQRNVTSFIDSVVLHYAGATVQSHRAERHGRSKDYTAFFYGDVRLRDRGVFMKGDEGEFVEKGNYAELRGRVSIRDSTGVIYARRVRYYRDARMLWLWGQVDFQDKATRVQADSVQYWEERGFGEAFGNVVLTDQERDSEARGSHGYYDRVAGEAWLDRRPLLVLRDADGRQTIVEADESRFNQARREGRVRGNVRITRDSTVAVADSAILYDDRDLFLLRGKPRVRRGAARISGEEIDVRFGDEDIEQVRVRRRALLVQSRADTLLVPDANQVAGDSATIEFTDGRLRRAVVSGHGSSTYVPVEARANRISLNEAQSDSIVMLFENDDIQEVLFIGNASGTYRYYEGDLEALRRGPSVAVDTTFGVVRGDTTRFDFRRQAEIVQYSAERILYLAPFDDLHLQGSASVDYQGRTLQAGDITFDADTQILTARQEPVLLDGGQRVYGERMGYDLPGRRAFVEDGATVYDQGYYRGERLMRDPDGTLEAARARYTSCDLETPHYDFRSGEMKIYPHDMAVGRPVLLYLGDIPVFYLPFFFNSIDPGRKSGFLMPDIEIGVGSQSRYIRGLDYYWAASDYWDVLFSSSYNERSRVNRTTQQSVRASAGQSRNLQFGANLRYKLRYRLDGNLEYRRSDDIDSDAHFVTMRGNHRQTLNDRMSLNGTLDFASSDQAVRATNEFVDYDRARQRQLTSSLTFNRRGGLASTTVSLQRRQIIDPDPNIVNQSVLSQTLPSLSLRFRNIRLAPRPGAGGPGWQRFLSDLQFAPNLSVLRNVDDVRLQRLLDASTGEVITDTTGVDSLITQFYTRSLTRTTASTSLGLTRQSSLWFLTLNPSLSYGATYTDDDRTPKVFEDRFTQSLSANLGASTRLYGIFRPHLGGLRALRHTIEPSATYSYAAALSGSEARHGWSLGLRNTLDAKVGKKATAAGDTNAVGAAASAAAAQGKETERRIDGLFEWSLGTNYDPDRPRRWGNISSLVTLNRHGPLRLTVSQIIDPYRKKIVSTSVPFTLRLAGSFGAEAVAEDGRLNRIARQEGALAAPADSVKPTQNWGFSESPTDGLEALERARDLEPGERLTWELAFSYSLSRAEGRNLSRNVAVGAALKPTRKWTVRWRANFDTEARQWISPSLDVERDLHCWRASFSRVFNAYDDEWRYYFRIFVVRHQDELFLESGQRSFGY